MTENLFTAQLLRGDYPCPWCGERNDCSIALGEDKAAIPGPGDITICHSCAGVAVFQEVGKPRKPTEQEWKNINTDQAMTDLRKAIFMGNKGNVNRHVMDI